MKLIFTFLFCVMTALCAQSQTVCASNYAMTCDETLRTEADIKNLKRLLAAQECRLVDILRKKEELFACMASEQNTVNLDRAAALVRSALLELESLKNTPTKVLKPCLTGDCK